MLNLNSLLIGSADSKALAGFYEKILDKKPDMVQGDWYGFMVGSCFLGIGSHDKVRGVSKNPERVIFNFESTDVRGEFARMKKLGAKVILEPYEMEGMEGKPIATLADPDGNYFQLMSPWESGK